MEKFSVLPTDDRFKDLTDSQIGFILESMTIDNKQRQLAAKGVDPNNYFEDEDTSFWNVPIDDFEPLKEEHSLEEINKQVTELLGKEDIKKARDRFETTEEYNEYLENGGKLARDMEVDAYIDQKLEDLFAEADEINQLKAAGKDVETDRSKYESKLQPREVETMEEAIDLFEGKFDDDDDDFYI